MACEHRVAIITGASSGIGAAAAHALSRDGFAVSLAGRNVERLKKEAQRCVELAKSDKLVLTTNGDVADEEHLRSLVQRTVDQFGRIDVLVNNAGGWFESNDPAVKSGIEAFDKTIDLNVRSAIQLTDLCEPHLLKTKGNIINISSVAGTMPNPLGAFYSMSKAALNMFTSCSALRYAALGIRVNAISPGGVATPIMQQVPDEWKEALVKMHPVGRMGEPAEVAELIAFLADNKRAGFITGSIYTIDGGLTGNSALCTYSGAMEVHATKTG